MAVASPANSAFDPERLAPRLVPLGATLAVFGCCLGGWFGVAMLMLGLGALLVSTISRRDGLLVLGPFARWELVRSARSRRFWLWKVIYAVAAGGVVLGALAIIEPDMIGFTPRPLSRNRLADANALMFSWLAVGLSITVCILTVQLIASAIAEDREAKRWEILLTTDLRGREILFGKLAGRLPRVLLPVLVAIPVLSLTPLFGGVSPVLVAVFGVCLIATVFGLAGVALFYSTFAATSKSASSNTIGLAFLYLVGSGVGYLLTDYPNLWTFPTSIGVSSSIEVADLVDLIAAGNPAAAIVSGLARAGPMPDVEAILINVARRYAAFHLGVFLLFSLIAAARVRRAQPWLAASNGPAEKSEREVPTKPVPKPRKSFLPPVSDEPVYWWERYGRLNRTQLQLTAALTPRYLLKLGLSVTVAFAMVWVLDYFWWWGPGHAPRIAREFLTMGIAFMCVIALVTPIGRATGAITRERRADTLTGLRLTALTSEEILFQKWRACACTDAPLIACILVITSAGVLSGLLHPFNVLGLTITLPIYSGAGAAIGLWTSVISRTTEGAVRWLVALGVIWFFVLSVLTSPLPLPTAMTLVWPPAATSVIIIYPGQGRGGFETQEVWQGTIGVALGCLVYAGLGYVAWRHACQRFDAEIAD